MNDKLIWYYEIQDRRIGPISSNKLKMLLELGEIGSHQIVWRLTPEKKVYVRAGLAVESFAADGTAVSSRDWGGKIYSGPNDPIINTYVRHLRASIVAND